MCSVFWEKIHCLPCLPVYHPKNVFSFLRKKTHCLPAYPSTSKNERSQLWICEMRLEPIVYLVYLVYPSTGPKKCSVSIIKEGHDTSAFTIYITISTNTSVCPSVRSSITNFFHLNCLGINPWLPGAISSKSNAWSVITISKSKRQANKKKTN